MIEAALALLDASDLPARWRRQDCFVVLDTAWRDAERFLACWQLWRGGGATPRPQAAGRAQLHVISVAPWMPSRAELQARWMGLSPPGTATALSAMQAELLSAWPPAVPGLHRLAFEGGQVQLLLAAGGSVRAWLPQLVARVDAFFIDADTLASDADPSWPLRLFKAASRLAAPGATLAMPAGDDAARAALRTAGFVLSDSRTAFGPPSGAGEAAPARDVVWCARHAPAFAARRPVAVASTPPAERHAWIVGAGLAGCATAWALAELGWHCTLLDRHDAPAQAASGNPAGLFHGVVHPQDGAHARFNRAAALEAGRAVRTAIDRHGVAGDDGGLLRIEAGTSARPIDPSAMERTLRQSGLPHDYVRLVDADQASALAGMPIAHPCWHFPGGGWVQPAGLARAFIERGGERVHFIGGVTVAALHRGDEDASSPNERSSRRSGRTSDAVTRWQMVDPSGKVIGESAVVVLANAGDASALLAPHATAATPSAPVLPSPLQSVRGQLSVLPVAELARALPGLVLPRLPVVGSGWLLPAIDGLAVFGATAQAGDGDPAVRPSDHAANIAALGRLTGLRFAGDPPPGLRGRTAWRCVAADRLPLIGAVPGATADESAGRHTEPIPRLPGFYTFSALGSRGITWAALGAQVLASLITGAPVPLARGLVEAVDPGRFLLRQQRRRGPPG